MAAVLPDVVGPDTRLLLAGINPGRRSAETGCHYAGPGNRFWPALHAAGLTSRVLRPHEQHELTAAGVGLTVLVDRSTARADELTRQELADGGRRLAARAAELDVAVVAVLGVAAYRLAFDLPGAGIGRQTLAGPIRWWVLPNPSGLNARWRVSDHAELLRRAAADAGLVAAPGTSSDPATPPADQ